MSRRTRRPAAPGRLTKLLTRQDPGSVAVYSWLYSAIILGFVLVISYCHIRSLDVWWHLKTGELIWTGQSIPRVDPFSHTAEGRPWISHEWLFGLFIYGIHRVSGVAGLVSVKALLIAMTFAVTAWAARMRGASAGMIFLVQAAAFAISRFRFSERPEMLSTLLAAGFLVIQDQSRIRPRVLLLLPAMQLVWVNAHGGTALLGWVLAVVILLERAWDLRQRSGKNHRMFDYSGLRWHLPAVVGVIAVSIANPHGHRALFYGLLRTQSPLDNKEFQSLMKMMRSGIDLSIVLFLTFAAILALLLLLRRRDSRPHEWLLFTFLLALTVTFFRFRPLFVFLLIPALSYHLTRVSLLSRVRQWIPGAVALMILARSAALERGTYFYRFGAGVHDGVLPVKAVEYLREARVAGRMFNTYGMGGYLIWEVWPEKKVFIDGREDVYLEAGVLEEYVRCFESKERWEALIGKYGIDFAILRYPESPPENTERSLEILAFPRKEWALIYFDEVALIYARRNGLNDDLIRRSEVRMVQPLQLSSYLDAIVKDPGLLSLFLAEMDANARRHPSSFRNHFTLGMLAIKRGPDSLGEALRQFERAVALNPDFAPAYVNLGSIYLHLGRARDAEAVLRKALSLEDSPQARAQLDRSRSLR